MSELDRIVDAFILDKSDKIKEHVSDEENVEMTDALRNKIKSKIIEEIKHDYKEEIVKEADLEVKKALNKKKLNYLKV